MSMCRPIPPYTNIDNLDFLCILAEGLSLSSDKEGSLVKHIFP